MHLKYQFWVEQQQGMSGEVVKAQPFQNDKWYMDGLDQWFIPMGAMDQDKTCHTIKVDGS